MPLAHPVVEFDSHILPKEDNEIAAALAGQESNLALGLAVILLVALVAFLNRKSDDDPVTGTA